jgi:hypothetical protein
LKLSKLDIEILQEVRARLEITLVDSYICFILHDVCREWRHAEMNKRINRILFWRRKQILDKWLDVIEHELSAAIRVGLRQKTTMGIWLEDEIRDFGIVPGEGPSVRHNLRLYKLARLAWLDRSIETGELK